jgi:hypothetical protein
MTLRDVLIILLILVVLSFFFGVKMTYGGPIGLVILILLILVLMGKL